MAGFWGDVNDVNVNYEVSDAGYNARVTFRCLVCCTGRIGLRLHTGFGSNVSSAVRLNHSVTGRHEEC